MILADKILSLRKQAGWSQEELAERLGVSRQSVSKWEGAQSIPDIDKIVQLSRLFGVSTDFLLKEEQKTADAVPCEEQPELCRVSMEQANAYLALRRAAAPKIALGTSLCVISPAPLILLSALTELLTQAKGQAAGIAVGLVALLVMVTVAVVLFITCGAKSKDYEFLDKEPFEAEYGVDGMVREHMRAFRDRYTRLNVIGVALCILGLAPLLAVSITGSELLCIIALCFLLLSVAIACYAFVYGGTIQASMKRLLEEDEFSRENKKKNGLTGTVSAIYWLVVTAIFFYYTFGPRGNGQPQYSWFIWAIGGVVYAALMALLWLIRWPRK